MTRLDIKNHMMQVKIATLSSLCRLFNADADTLRCLLSHWVEKGIIRQGTRKSACGKQCVKCPTDSIEIYEWVYN